MKIIKTIKKSMDEDQVGRRDFKTINYLGSKLRILDFIQDNIDNIDPSKGAICDLFAGSGSVSYRLSAERRIIASDIQEYSRVLCSALLNPVELSNDFKKSFIESFAGEHYRQICLAVKPLMDLEQNAMTSITDSKSIQILTEIIEYGSIVAYDEIDNTVTATISNCLPKLNDIQLKDSLITRYFGGVYFSYKQAAQLDAIQYAINLAPYQQKDILVACLLSTASDVVNTVGKHFAQPIRPRDSSGKIKPNLAKALQRDRTIDVFETYAEWLDKYSSIEPSPFVNTSLRCDYRDALNNIPDDVTVIYADPPYTRDHYSRFYHVLETLALRDIPEITTTKIHGEEKISRGLYRKERHQSPFCIRQQAIEAFSFMFQKISKQDRKLILSYSPYDETKKTHPRVVTMDALVSLARKYFDNVDVVSAGFFSHNKLNSTVNLLEASNTAEVLIICT